MDQRKETDGVCGLRWARRFWFLTVALAAAPGFAEDEGYDLVQSPPPAHARAGAKTVLSLSVVPRTGHRLLADGPVHVRVTASGAHPARSLYQREDAVDPRADVPRFELTLTTDKHKGTAKVDAACTFYLCKDTRCRPIETTATWTFPSTSSGWSSDGDGSNYFYYSGPHQGA